MSRASLVLVIVLVLIVAALGWLGHRSGSVPTHRIEKTVTLNGADGASQ